MNGIVILNIEVSPIFFMACWNGQKSFCMILKTCCLNPLSNTLHDGNGEIGISLYDMKTIGGLPILGVPYEDFIPPNKDIGRCGKYSATIQKLLNIYSQLCALYR
ncbi:hypothetical protein DVH24_018749 [Malus domestica]|uniref:Uncharacterized protein n=1 Tax=Malus domestica TaxID=3750 RepID=A0A498HM86_MALDO|nr:hypothetical protein DVH24_018749 [Malus domestica]